VYTNDHMKLWPKLRRKSARVIIIRENKLLVFHRKRLDASTNSWVEYYSIPGGGIDRGETPEVAAVRELREEMGVEVRLISLVATSRSRYYEHIVYLGEIIDGEPTLQLDSEEAAVMSEKNQFEVEWVDIDSLTQEKLLYYGHYYELIKQLAVGNVPSSPAELHE